MTNALAPVLTVIISLLIYMVIPHPVIITGMVFAVIAAFLLAIEEETDVEPGEELKQMQQEIS